MRTTRSTRGTPRRWYRPRGACAGFGTASIVKGASPRSPQAGACHAGYNPSRAAGASMSRQASTAWFALSELDGRTLWRRGNLGNVRSTVAYDAQTQSVFVVSSNGNLYRLDAKSGIVRGVFRTNQSSTLPLPPAVFGSRVWFSMGNSVYCVNKLSMRQAWRYNTGSTVETPPAYSTTRDLVVVACEDLSIHGIDAATGTRRWRTVIPNYFPGETMDFRYGWPVIADGAGVVLVKLCLPWTVMWVDWPQTNAAIRQFLTQNPQHQALYVLRLSDGVSPYIANIGHGGYGDSDYLPMGPQPVVKRFPNGKEVVYTVVRAKHVYDSRWDSHFGEMMLDDTTVPGLQGGDIRFIAYDHPPGHPRSVPADRRAAVCVDGGRLSVWRALGGGTGAADCGSFQRAGQFHEQNHLRAAGHDCKFARQHRMPLLRVALLPQQFGEHADLRSWVLHLLRRGRGV
jgi:hypothetical protein